MDTKALRQKILDLAIRGKLVLQDPNDEPAPVLLERIRAEKQQMVKEGKLKAKDIKNDTIIFRGEDNLHYEKFQDGTVKCIEEEIPFEVPEGWEWERLKNVFIINPKNNIYDNIIVSFVPMTMISDQYSGTYSYNEKTWSECKKGFTHFAENDIGFAKISPCFENRKSAHFIGLKNGYGAGTTELYILRCYTEDIIAKYILYFIKSDYFIKRGVETFSGVVGQQRVNKDIVMDTFIPIPPLSEQIRVTSKCKNLLDVVDNVEFNKEQLTEIVSITKLKVLDFAIRGKLIPQNSNDEPASVLLERIRAEKEELIKQEKIKRDKKESIIFKGDDNSYYERVDNSITKLAHEDLFDLPNGWEYVRLKDITIKLVDGSHNPPKGEPFQTEYIMASSRNINDDTIVDLNNVRYISKEQFKKENARTNISENDILLTTVATLGRSCLYKNNPPNLCLQRSVTVITPLIIIPQYLKLFFDSPRFQKLINKEATGTAQKGFYLNQLENVIIPIPPLNEQYAVTSYASKLMEQLNNIMNVVGE